MTFPGLSDGRSRSQEWSVTCPEQNLPPHLLHVEVARTPQTLHTDGLRPLKYASRLSSADDSSPLRHHVDVLEGAICQDEKRSRLDLNKRRPRRGGPGQKDPRRSASPRFERVLSPSQGKACLMNGLTGNPPRHSVRRPLGASKKDGWFLLVVLRRVRP